MYDNLCNIYPLVSFSNFLFLKFICRFMTWLYSILHSDYVACMYFIWPLLSPFLVLFITLTGMYVNYLLSDADGKESSSIMQSSYFSVLKREHWYEKKITSPKGNKGVPSQGHLIHAVEQSHGDMKCENVFVTSWNWLYLTDFASFKPTYIPDDGPSDFLLFFNTGGRRNLMELAIPHGLRII